MMWRYRKIQVGQYLALWNPRSESESLGNPSDGTELGIVTKCGDCGKWNMPGGGYHKTRNEACDDHANRTYWYPKAAEANFETFAWWQRVPQVQRTVRTLTEDAANHIYTMLVNALLAPESYRDVFVHDQTGPDPTYEWRFGGMLGFGGKFRNESSRFRVDMYQEDQTPYLLWLEAKANRHLVEMYKRIFPEK